VAFFGSHWSILVLVMAATSWMDIARVIRAEVMSLKERDFIKAAQVLGLSRARIIFRHLLPNALAPVIACAALRLADVILIESSLSFLGLGVQPPAVSWGSIIRDGRDVLASAWWIATFPGLAILLTAMGLNWMSEGLRKSF
jgi:peptide/nickel transport system permease protein